MKNALITALKAITKEADQRSVKISVLGVGSELRGDDGAGLLVAENLAKRCEEDKCGINTRLQVIYGATAPENFTSEIKKFAPTYLVIVDAAEMGEKPGTARFIKREEVTGVTFSTHLLPLSVMLDYLGNSFEFKTIVIGIEPKDMGFDHKVSQEVALAVKTVSDAIYDFIKELI